MSLFCLFTCTQKYFYWDKSNLWEGLKHPLEENRSVQWELQSKNWHRFISDALWRIRKQFEIEKKCVIMFSIWFIAKGESYVTRTEKSVINSKLKSNKFYSFPIAATVCKDLILTHSTSCIWNFQSKLFHFNMQSTYTLTLA